VTNFATNRALVLAVTSLAGVGQGTGTDSDQPTVGGNYQVRLALPPSDVEKVVHASEFGKVWLSRQDKRADLKRQVVTSKDVVK
jgi:hypothetical protein